MFIMISIMSESENQQKLNFVYDISAPSKSIHRIRNPKSCLQQVRRQSVNAEWVSCGDPDGILHCSASNSSQH